MGKNIATIIVEPRLLVREALASLMASHSYHVVGGVASTADIDDTSLAADAPRLVILGALRGEDVATAASSIRKLWPESKIVLLFDHASPVDFQKLLAWEIDGCIPLSASPDTLIGTLRQVVAADLRILVLRTATCLSAPRVTGGQEEGDELGPGTHTLTPSTAHEAATCSVVALPSARPPIAAVVCKDVGNGVSDGGSSIRDFHSLSMREEQILKGLMVGHSNKMIARTYNVTEATIKVHMKSILRKIRVANRTQAAIWALEQGYCADASKNQAIAGAAAQCASNRGRVEADPSTVIGMATA
jgi:two-component system, NarL family, nitrate/nitrite response regulator NarL